MFTALKKGRDENRNISGEKGRISRVFSSSRSVESLPKIATSIEHLTGNRMEHEYAVGRAKQSLSHSTSSCYSNGAVCARSGSFYGVRWLILRKK